jgi:hypothetical protein
MATSSEPTSTASSRRTWYRDRPFTPILFVVVTALLWYAFQLLVRIVLTCLPGGDACLLGWAPWPLHGLFWPVASASRFLYGSAWLDGIVSLVTLALALWPALRIFFPADDLSAPARQETPARRTETSASPAPVFSGVTVVTDHAVIATLESPR